MADTRIQDQAQGVIAKKSNPSTALTKAELIEQRIEASKKRLEELKRKKKALEKRQKVLESKEERRADTRRKILLGSMLLAEIEKGGDAWADLLVKLDAYLRRDDDRALFDLPPQAQAQAEKPPTFEELAAAVTGK